MNTKDKAHDLSIVAGWLDGMEIEYFGTDSVWRVITNGELHLSDLKENPERYRLKQETVTVYLYFHGGRYKSTVKKGTWPMTVNSESVIEIDTEIPIPSESGVLELVEILDGTYTGYWRLSMPIDRGMDGHLGRKLLGFVVEGE